MFYENFHNLTQVFPEIFKITVKLNLSCLDKCLWANWFTVFKTAQRKKSSLYLWISLLNKIKSAVNKIGP